MLELNFTPPSASCCACPGYSCDFGEPENYPDRSGLIPTVGVVRCHNCGIGITVPPIADVTFLYEGRGSQDFQPLSTGAARTIKEFAFRREARRLIMQVGAKPRRVLDFGCGSGLFTRCLGAEMTSGEVVGSDFHLDPPLELSDRPYLSNERLSSGSERFDLILAMHVIEHDNEPARLLRMLRKFGTDNCMFVFEVPNIDCVWARVFGQSWDAWYLPFHRIHFSRTSFRGLLNICGFDVVREIDATVPSMGRSIANLLGKQNTLPFLLIGAILHPIQWIVERTWRSPSALRFVVKVKR